MTPRRIRWIFLSVLVFMILISLVSRILLVGFSSVSVNSSLRTRNNTISPVNQILDVPISFSSFANQKNETQHQIGFNKSRLGVCYLILAHNRDNLLPALLLLEKIWEAHYHILLLLDHGISLTLSLQIQSWLEKRKKAQIQELLPIEEELFGNSKAKELLRSIRKKKSREWLGLLASLNQSYVPNNQSENLKPLPEWPNVEMVTGPYAGGWGYIELVRNTQIGFKKLWSMSTLPSPLISYPLLKFKDTSPPMMPSPWSWDRKKKETQENIPSWSLMEAVIRAPQKVTALIDKDDSKCEYFALLSGDSFPALSNEEIERRFLVRRGESSFSRFRSNVIKNYAFEGRANGHNPPPPFREWRFGSQWVILHKSFAKYAFWSEDAIMLEKFMKSNNFDIGDESLFPTLYDLWLERRGIKIDWIPDNLHLCWWEVWQDYQNHPEILVASEENQKYFKDFSSRCFYGRKFQLGASDGVYQWIVNEGLEPEDIPNQNKETEVN